MNNSFYGGRDGRPMIIKKKYSTIAEMLEVFKDPSNLEVNFGEYAIIETVNRNNPENGRIFRRGSDYGNKTSRIIDSWILNTETNLFENQSIEAYGAIFISQIVGPSGNAPHLHLLSTKNDVTEQYQDYSNKPGYDVKTGEQDSEASILLQNLVPGKEENGNFNDNISWRYCSVRDENQQETDAYIGFEIPYTVIEWDAHSENPYYNRNNDTNDFINMNLITRHEDDKDAEHPFYQKWQIHIPKGIHGQSIKNLRIVNEGTEEEPKQVLKYDYYDYDTIGNPEAETMLLGDYNMIDDIIIDKDDGTITIKYTYDDTEVWTELLTWIKSIKIAEDGTVTVASNNGTILLAEDQKKLKWPINIKVNDNGTITTEYNNGDPSLVQGPTMNWIESATLDGNKVLTINYVNYINENEDTKNISVNLETPNKITFENGVFTAIYNSDRSEQIGFFDGQTVNTTVAASEEEIDSNLRVGGIAFITQEN